MILAASKLIWFAYAVAPLVGLSVAFARYRRSGQRRWVVAWALAGFWGMLIGGALAWFYAHAAGGGLSMGQVLRSGWVVFAMLLVLRAVQWSMDSAVRAWVSRVRGGLRVAAWSVGTALRTVVLFAVVLPYVMAVMMVYRTKVLPADTPKSLYGSAYESVQFNATDGSSVAGWWIPATGKGERSKQSVIICHGLGSNRSNQLNLAEPMIRAGWNVLTIDLRAHGESGGQVTSFGDFERYDVLGAVKWLEREHAGESQRIMGVGASMGAAALVSAAGDDSPAGQRIAAVVVWGSFDDFGALSRDVVHHYFPRPLSWLLEKIALPVADLHAGTQLGRFAPADSISKIWPRPVMVLHGLDDSIIPYNHGLRLFNAAQEPKRAYWINGLGHNDLINHEPAQRAVIEFLDTARTAI